MEAKSEMSIGQAVVALLAVCAAVVAVSFFSKELYLLGHPEARTSLQHWPWLLLPIEMVGCWCLWKIAADKKPWSKMMHNWRWQALFAVVLPIAIFLACVAVGASRESYLSMNHVYTFGMTAWALSMKAEGSPARACMPPIDKGVGDAEVS